MKKKTIFFVEEDVFRTVLTIIGNCSYKEMEHWVKNRSKKYQESKEETGENTIGTTFPITDDKGNFSRIVWIHHLNLHPDSIACLTHELFHVVIRVMQGKGIVTTEKITAEGESWNGDETAAYLLESYTKKCLQKLRKK